MSVDGDAWRSYKKRTMRGEYLSWKILGFGLLVITMLIGGWKYWEWKRSVLNPAAAENEIPYVPIEERGE